MSRISSLEYKLPQAKPQRSPWFFWLSDELLMNQSWWGAVLRKLRRSYFAVFYPEYVKASIETLRAGDCTRCGACCELVYRCPFLGYDANKLAYCRIYGELRPQSCKNYPFDRVDSDIEQCGFKFN